MGQSVWDERYQGAEFAYGTAPNEFLRDQMAHLATGKILCLAEGEGRNAVYLAEHGFDVTAIDQSSVGLGKAQHLAENRGVHIHTVVADLADYELEPDAWDGIVSIFAHMPVPARQHLHRQVVGGLRPGGVFLLEAYRPAQLQYGTGGPPVAELMMNLDGLRTELAGLAFEYADEIVRDVHEGTLHRGTGAVVQVRARKPTG